MSGILLFSSQATVAEYDYPREARRLQGAPKRTTWNHFTNASGEVSSGVWACEVGSWRIEMGATEDEFFHVTEGRCCLIDEAGRRHEAGVGESLIIPAGFKGIFEVIEPMKKHYVIIDRKA
ncbi:cupin domain-containing protein [Chitinimonas sp.]|uniref:cupin domain-containing protein n=1 Tax=Chitinimonas sp. TaxID=1934313 RepID=UPI0035B1781F